MSEGRAINAAMSALIDGTCGCLDAAAETINARLGVHVGKGTLSKYLSGQLQWPLAYVWALEDAAGRYPVSAVRGRAIGARADPRGCVYAAVGAASKEFGEAAEAALRVAGSADGAERAVALQEAREALDEMARLVAAIEAGGAP